jgi:valyl-tRNA synthetase
VTERDDDALHYIHELIERNVSTVAFQGTRIACENKGDRKEIRSEFGIPNDGTIRICIEDDPAMEKELEEHGFQRDPDVLDTWFSSSLWPFSTMGWPDETPELKTFYPGDVLCTAREIITLWVSRMVMMGQYCRGEPPFSDVFIHAMIQDGEGRKMSKSLGNGIDPLDIIDSHGADAMRFTLVSMTTQTQDVRMPVAAMKLPDGRGVNSSPKFDMGRNFCNKLWNASRFAMMNLRPCPAWGEVRASASLSDRWILSRLNATIRDATAALEGFRFNELGDTLYHFLWDDFCDWYLEIAKIRINAGENQPRAVLAHCLDVVLRLLHPVAPFITEAIWDNLNQTAPMRGPGMQEAEPMLARAAWPLADAAAMDERAEKDFATLQELIRQIRNVRTQHNVPPGKSLSVEAHVEAGAANLAALLSENANLMCSLAGLEKMLVVRAEGVPPSAGAEDRGQDALATPPADAASIAAAGVKLYVLGAVDRAAELTRLTKQQATLAKGIGAIEAKLGNAGFVAKAPPAVVEKERARLEGLKAELAAVEKSLAALKDPQA